MSNFSPQILADREVKACSKALSIMVHRFTPMNCNCFYSAKVISDQVGDLPNGQLSTLYVETDTLKKALANQKLRDGLTHLLPGKILFNRSCSKLDIIVEGPFAFQKGYQVKLLTGISVGDSSDNFREEITNLQEALIEYYSSCSEKDCVKMVTCTSAEKSNKKTLLCFDTPIDSVKTDTVIKNKRGRPELDIEDHQRNIKNLRMQIDYYKSNNSNEKHKEVEKTVGEKIVELIKVK